MKHRSLPALCLVLICGVAAAEPSLTLQELSERTQQQQRADALARSERLAEFIAARDDANAKLTALREQVVEARNLNTALQTRFDNQRADIQNLDRQIAEQSGDLNAVFIAARQRAGEMASSLRHSLASAQSPERVGDMKALADTQGALDIASLTALWRAMQQEILASAQSSQFSGPLITGDGSRETADIVRIGLFNAVSDGRFLSYDHDLGAFTELRRQPTAALRDLANRYQQASASPAVMVIDPTRGSLLSLTTQRPELIERLHQGGQVGYLILALGVAGLLLALWRWVALALISKRMHKQLERLDQPDTDNPLGRVLAGYTQKTDDIDSVAMQIEEAILHETPRLTRGEALLKLLAGIAPLLGLLGTVTGMIATFQAISLFGAGDPRLMADGISQALVTTALGLIVAIPLLLAHLLVSARSRRLVNMLEEQSAGLIARSQGWRE